ncbi:MAG: hypothetical protein CXB60_11355 [Spiroplasma poulsonii]|nr:hypothetical protein [Spiroplasma poulsonii]
MALTKEQLIEQGLSKEIAENILNQFNNEAKQIRESVQKREDVISKEDFIKLSNRLLALLVKKLQIFVKKILIEKYNFN